MDGDMETLIPVIPTRDIRKYCQAMYFFAENYPNPEHKKIQTEMKVYSKKLGIAGTIDLVLETDDGLVLIDWKTNKEIKTSGYKGQKAKEPLQDVQDCNLSKYSLQLNLYKYILETEYNKTVCGLKMVHLRDDGYSVYNVPFLAKQVIQLLKEKQNEQKDK